MNKRLMMLEKMVAGGSADSFARYALAMEYRSEGRPDDALATFFALRETDPEYLPQYLMAGQMLIDHNRADEARSWLEQGLTLARSKGDTRALAEIQDALSNC